MHSIKIGLVQMRAEKGALEENFTRIKQYIREALKQGLDFLCLPEMSITGYINPLKQPQFALNLTDPEIARVVELTSGTNLTLIAGFVERHPEGQKPYITQFVAYRGKLMGYYRKITIEGDEAPYFSAGSAIRTFDYLPIPFGLAICADINNPQVFSGSAEAGAKIIFHAAAPGLYGEQATRNWSSGYRWWQEECSTKIGRYARENGVYIGIATQAGRTIDEDFPGGGYLFAPNGECIAATPNWSPGVLYADLSL
ncbi:MAG TPA: carbon-nitrogen hydrolase family protein [Chloroflexia bacterium]|nr:carbon-nitrogen hydrolase family protein [Chloroflexia bacterium]